jgi:glycosyltransferase involved in cell wall biosynthesis
VSCPGVTVVIPTRDRADLLALTLRSVLAQRDVDLDVIVVDDGGCHATAGLIEEIRDPRVALVRNDSPPGVSGARNRGVQAAARPWIAFCDDDDLWAPGKLAAQLAAVLEKRAAWVYAGDVTVDAALRVLSGGPPPTPDAVLRELPRYNAVPAGASNVLVRLDALLQTGPFDTDLQTSEDWDMWLRLARTAGRPACVPRPLVALRSHARMVSRRADSILADIEVLAHRYRMPVDRARHYRWAAWMALEDGRRATAMRYYARAAATGDWRSAGRALVALVDPGVTRRRGPAAADPWAADAQQWLDELRDARAVSTS